MSSGAREFLVTVAVAMAWIMLAPSALANEGPRWDLLVCADPNAMPLSHRSETGYENRIAAILADELGANLVYDWYPQGVDMINLRLRGGHCDVIMGVPDGHEPLLTSLAYYRSPYAFVYRADAPFEVTSLDDPVLADLRIALQAVGIPPHEGLVRRGLAGNVVANFGTEAYATRADPKARVIEALVDGTADLALAWGPVAGYYAKQSEVPMVVRPVQPMFDPPFGTQIFAMTVGVRRGDDALRDEIGYALATRWTEIVDVLEEFGVLLEPTPRPTLPRELP